jgi:hypothetical protein
MVEGSTTRTTSFTLAEVAGNAVTTSVYIGDGRARTVSFTTDLSGQVIKRTESDNVWTQGDPSQMWFRFGGRQMGMVTNNGISEAPSPFGPFLALKGPPDLSVG